jgi:hypothetical protein
VTFKELRKIITEKKKEMEIEAKYYDPNYYWKAKKIVSLDQWYQIKEGYGLKAALQFFPNDYRNGFACTFDDIENTALKQEADQWYSDYVKLMEYSKNTEYGKKSVFVVFLVQIERKLQYSLE